MNQGLGFKELYEVSLKTTYPIEVGGKTYESGEIIAIFDKIQLANFQEVKTMASANGGYDNRSLIIWEETKELRLNFAQGIFSKEQLALMSNARLLSDCQEEFLLDKREKLETSNEGRVSLSFIPKGQLFVYDYGSGKKIKNWSLDGKELILNSPYQEIIVDYQYPYKNKHEHLQVGTALTQGYLALTGKTRIKDDITGQVKTGIIKIPRLKLMSDLSMRLGEDAIPQVGRLDAIALPVGEKGNKKVMEIIFLDDDVDSDM